MTACSPDLAQQVTPMTWTWCQGFHQRSLRWIHGQMTACSPDLAQQVTQFKKEMDGTAAAVGAGVAEGAIPAEPKTPCASPPGRCQPLSRRRQGQMAPALPQRCSRSVAGAKRLRCRRQKSVAGPFTAAAASFMPNRVLLIRDGFYFGSPTVYPYLRPMTRCLCAGVGVVVRILINILAGRECACVCV